MLAETLSNIKVRFINIRFLRKGKLVFPSSCFYANFSGWGYLGYKGYYHQVIKVAKKSVILKHETAPAGQPSLSLPAPSQTALRWW